MGDARVERSRYLYRSRRRGVSALNDWPTPSGWLYGFIDTSVPGYRLVDNDGTALQLADGYYNFPAYIDQLNTKMATDGGTATTDALGRVVIAGSAPMTWTDQLGWMIGLDVKPGDDSGSSATRTSDRPPPAAIPLMSVSWKTVNRAVETIVQVDRHQRGHGYLFGDGDVMRFRMLLHVQALRSFREGWCLSGQVIISTKNPADFSTDSPWSPSNTDGYIQGYVLGTERGKWIDTTKTLWQTEILVSKA